jgi:glycosyltransferase involved in cell wall biosynthesis/tetratricopeptide (TPR) repeat protein
VTPARPPLLIVQIGPPEPLDRGEAVYRTIQPCRALGELADVTVVSGSILSPALYASAPSGTAEGADGGLLLAADILVIRDVADPDLLPVIAARRRNGRLTVYEISSHVFARPPGEAAASAGEDLAARSLPPQLARQADCLQLATAALDAQFAGLNPRRAIFPSQLWEAPVIPPARPADRLVIGWAGTRAERADLELALPALGGVLDRHPEVRLAIMGDPELQAALASFPAARVSFIPSGSFERRQRFLDEIDIGIAPLAATAYNRCRDDVRFLEYAAHGVLAVCADLEPFHEVVRPGQTGFLFRDAAELETVLERALAEAEVRAAIPARAARAAAERLERPHAAHRLGFYLSVAAQMGIRLEGGNAHAAFPPPELSGPLEAPRAFPDSRYLALGAGKIDRLLIEGWQRRNSEAGEALRAFEEAERLSPDSHLPPLLLGMTAADDEVALAALGRAEERYPLSCQASYLRGVRLLARGDEAAATAAFARARAIAPGFGAPQERLGTLAEAAGRAAEAAHYYEEAALQNGAFALPIARLATIARRDGRLDKAVALLERSLGDDPGLGLTNFLIGRAYVELKRFHQARVHLQRALLWAESAPAPQTAAREPLVAGAEDRAAVLAELGRAQTGLGESTGLGEPTPAVDRRASVNRDDP